MNPEWFDTHRRKWDELVPIHVTGPFYDVAGFKKSWIAAREVWPGIAAAVAAAFGRVIAEVGAVLIVGGNIEGETRVLTTAIVQEARQSNLGAALGLGIVLLLVALLVNLALTWAQLRGETASL